MKILMTNLFLQGYTGSESFLATLAEALRARGHEITFYVHNWGWFGEEMKAKGFECWYNPNKQGYKLPHTNFDLVHFQHRETVLAIYDQVKHLPKLFISHGMLPMPEQPLNFHTHPMEGYAGVSEETLQNCYRVAQAPDRKTEGAIVRNIIDTDRFKAVTPLNDTLTSVAVISNYMQRVPAYLNALKQVCEEDGLMLEIVGDAGKRVRDVRSTIEFADVVVGIGRCAMEAMAMGRNVLVFDYQGMEGMIDSVERYELFRTKNFSGRVRQHKDVTVQDVRSELARYSTANGKLVKGLIDLHHSPSVVVDVALDFYERVIIQHKVLNRMGKKRKEETDANFHQVEGAVQDVASEITTNTPEGSPALVIGADKGLQEQDSTAVDPSFGVDATESVDPAFGADSTTMDDAAFSGQPMDGIESPVTEDGVPTETVDVAIGTFTKATETEDGGLAIEAKLPDGVEIRTTPEGTFKACIKLVDGGTFCARGETVIEAVAALNRLRAERKI